MENRFQRENEFYSEENSVNLSQFNREEPASQNLDMCDDDLFNDLFPSNKDQELRLLEHTKEASRRTAILTHHLNAIQHNGNPVNGNARAEVPSHEIPENTAIERHVLYLMDQLPHSSNQTSFNPPPINGHAVVPKQEICDNSENRLDNARSDSLGENPSSVIRHISPNDSIHVPSPPNSRHRSSDSYDSSCDSPTARTAAGMSLGTKELVTNMIKSEPVDIEELTKKRSRRGRKRKTTESENELTLSYEREDNEYKRKRLRNNIAVRKSRDKAKNRQQEIQQKLVELANENKTQKVIIEKIKADYDGVEVRFEDLNKRLIETLKINVRMRQFINALPVDCQPKFPL